MWVEQLSSLVYATAMEPYDLKLPHQRTCYREPEAVIRHGMEFAHASLGASETLTGIGLAVPGVLDTSTWSLKEVVNLPHWTNRPLLAILEEESQLPCAVVNDANAAALAEHQLAWTHGRIIGTDYS